MGYPPIQGQDDPQTGGAPQSGGVHPAWNEALSVIPEDLHDQVVPMFQKWDQNVNKVHQRYSPYKEFLDNEVSPDDMREALMVARALTENPQGVYEILAKDFGGQQQTGQGLPGGEMEDDGDDPYAGLHPAIVEKLQLVDQLQGGMNTVAEVLLNERRSKEEASADKELDDLYKAIESQNPTFKALNVDGAAEPYINNLLQAGMSPEDAVAQFEAFVTSVNQYNARPKPPVLLGRGGSAVPGGGGIDPRKMSQRQTRDVVAETLRAALQANQGG